MKTRDITQFLKKLIIYTCFAIVGNFGGTFYSYAIEEEKEEEKKSETTQLNPDAQVFFGEISRLPSIKETREPKKKDYGFIDHTRPGKVKISKRFTQEIIPNAIKEQIENLYNYMNKSLMFVTAKYYPAPGDSLCIINYDFHDKLTGEALYCVILKQEVDNKYQWKMSEQLYKEEDILNRFNVKKGDLPQPIRLFSLFSQKLASINSNDLLQTLTITKIIHETKWHNIPVRSKKNNKERSVLYVSTSEFRNKLKGYININPDNYSNLVPIIMDNVHNEFWIEHVWVLEIFASKYNKYTSIGISLQFDSVQQLIKVTGIHLNKDFLSKKHMLTPCHYGCHCLDNFISYYDDVKVGDIDGSKNNQKQLKRKIKQLKGYKDKNSYLKAFVEKVKNSILDKQLAAEAAKILNNVGIDNEPVPVPVTLPRSGQSQHQSQVGVPLPVNPSYIPSYPENTSALSLATPATIATQQQPIIFTSIAPTIAPIMPVGLPATECLFAQLIPVTSSMTTTSISKEFTLKDMEGGVYISKQLTSKYLTATQELFHDTKKLFYYLNQTISMQISDKFALRYDSIGLVIINSDLHDIKSRNHQHNQYNQQEHDILYMIIQRNNNPANNHKFSWEMIALCNSKKIFEKHQIAKQDLPRSSRKEGSFINNLNTHTSIKLTSDIINFYDFKSAKVIKNKSRGSSKEHKKAIYTNSSKIRAYLLTAIQNNVNPIPIIKIKSNQHWIEAVIIAHIPEEDVDFGVSFRVYDDNGIEATSIFLDQIDIENQHNLTGASLGIHSLKLLDEFKSGISKLIIQ